MRKIFIALVCCLLLCSTAEATVNISGSKATITSESFTSTCTSSYPPSYRVCCYWNYGTSDQRPAYYLDDYFSNRSYNVCTLNKFSLSHAAYITIGSYSTTVYQPSGTTVNHYHGTNTSIKYNGYSSIASVNETGIQIISNGTRMSTIILNNCTFSGNQNFSGGQTITSGASMTINGGSYRGYPAISGNNITVTKGTLTDENSTHSVFMLGPDSEQQVSQGGSSSNTTITTVKLSNPPVIIDWADFPG